MLFLLNSAGVPSVAEFVTVNSAPNPPAPTVTTFSPASGSTGSVVQIDGTNLTGATGVSFNNVPATQFSVSSPRASRRPCRRGRPRVGSA